MTGFFELIEQAKSGDMEKQYELGNAYFFEYLGMKRDVNLAEYWYNKAAEQGHSGALCQLGYMNDGGGLGYKYEEAANLYTRSAKKGEVTAMWNLGKLFGEGHGVPRMPDIAEQWFIEAATKGDAHDKYTMGFKYQYAMFGLPKDPTKMLYWYNEAAKLDDVDALRTLAQMNATGKFVEENLAMAAELSERADVIEGII